MTNSVVPHRVGKHPTTPAPAPRDLSQLLRNSAAEHPDAVAVLDEGTIPVTRGQLWRRVCALASELREHGIGSGDCVAVWLPNWSDALVWQFAVAAVGGHVIGLNTRYNVSEVRHVLTRARPALIAVAHDFHGLDLVGRLREAVAGGPCPPVVPIAGPRRCAPDPTSADVGGGAWVPARSDGPDPDSTDPAAPVVVFTTSGSTGMPKLAAHSGSGVLAHAVADAATIPIVAGDAVLCALPLSGVFGYNAALAALAGGAVCVLEPVFDADATLEHMEQAGVTHIASGDDLVLRLYEAWNARPRDLSAWRFWGVADFQGRSHELAIWAAAAFGTRTSGVYGSSEVFALTAHWPDTEPEPQRWTGGGRVVHSGIEVRVADPESGTVLAPGVEGELQFRGPNVVDGYLGAEVPEAFTDDGWLHSGDLGVLIDDGVFCYVCRMGDALRLHGFQVDPTEIEARLAARPDVDTARVVGIPDENGATVAIAFVVPADGHAPQSDTLRTWCAEGLARYKVPETVHVIEAMPTTSGTNGTKIRAAELRDWARERRSQR